jgi:hypothetical protein
VRGKFAELSKTVMINLIEIDLTRFEGLKKAD